MPKYLLEVSYTDADGVRSVLREGASARGAAIDQAVQSVGGKLEAAYFAFGDDDLFVLADLPDNKSAAAISLAIAGAGAVRTKTVVLLTPEEVDDASKVSVEYRLTSS